LIMTVYYIYTYIIINLNLNVPSKLILFEEYLEILLGGVQNYPAHVVSISVNRI